MRLHDIAPAQGSTGKHFRIGRGHVSGVGKTSGRGHKGQKSRSGYSQKRGFEGGQMPLARRLPKRGFTNIFAKPLTAVNLGAFGSFPDGARITADELLAAGIIKKCPHGLKVLGGGEFKSKVTVVAAAFSDSAREKIEKAGGRAEVG